MRVCKVMLLMGILGLVTVSPAMAWRYVDRGYYYTPTVMVERPYYYADETVVYADDVPVVVERPYVYPRYYTGVSYFGSHGYYGGGHRYYSGGSHYYGGGARYFGGGHRSYGGGHGSYRGGGHGGHR